MNRVLNAVLDLIYPPKCVLCQKLLDRGEHGICRDCLRALPRNRAQISGERFSVCYAPFRYTGDLRESLLRMKFGNCPGYAAFYGEQIAACVRDAGEERIDLVSWAPVSRKRKSRRGYDQARLLAKFAAKQLGLPLVKTLAKTKDNQKQSTMETDAERRKNVRGVYQALHPERFEGKRVLLIDDIVTSGATLNECCGVLRAAGAKRVLCAAAAAARI